MAHVAGVVWCAVTMRGARAGCCMGSVCRVPGPISRAEPPRLAARGGSRLTGDDMRGANFGGFAFFST